MLARSPQQPCRRPSMSSVMCPLLPPFPCHTTPRPFSILISLTSVTISPSHPTPARLPGANALPTNNLTLSLPKDLSSAQGQLLLVAAWCGMLISDHCSDLSISCGPLTSHHRVSPRLEYPLVLDLLFLVYGLLLRVISPCLHFTVCVSAALGTAVLLLRSGITAPCGAPGLSELFSYHIFTSLLDVDSNAHVLLFPAY